MIRIHTTERGYMLKVNGKAVKKDSNSFFGVTCTYCAGKPNNWICTEFVTIDALRKFWADYRAIIIKSANV